MSYILTKFFAQKEYQQAFVRGDLYLSSLSAFTKVYSERALIAAAMQGDNNAKMLLEKQRNRSQRDILEGTIASIPPDQIQEFPDKMRKMIDTDVMIRALGYDYCNIMCFCKMEYRFQMLEKIIRIDWDEPNMKDFGEYAIIVKDPKELIRRIDRAVKRQNYQYVCGDVNYHPRTFHNKAITRNKPSVSLQLEKPIEMNTILKQGKRVDYDAFDKCDVYKNQREWRLAINNGVADEQPLQISVGDLSDIVEMVDRSSLADKMQELFMTSAIVPMEEGYYGNTSRTEMREAFYHLGKDRGYYIITLG